MASDSCGHGQATKLVQPKQPTPNQVHRERPSRRGRMREAWPCHQGQQRRGQAASCTLADDGVRSGSSRCEL